jgi:hypothetical protein
MHGPDADAHDHGSAAQPHRTQPALRGANAFRNVQGRISRKDGNDRRERDEWIIETGGQNRAGAHDNHLWVGLCAWCNLIFIVPDFSSLSAFGPICSTTQFESPHLESSGLELSDLESSGPAIHPLYCAVNCPVCPSAYRCGADRLFLSLLEIRLDCGRNRSQLAAFALSFLLSLSAFCFIVPSIPRRSSNCGTPRSP